jgi:hypothetical protein
MNKPKIYTNQKVKEMREKLDKINNTNYFSIFKKIIT